MTPEQIRAQAMSDYAKDGSYINPYRTNSPEFNAYERGWMQALKRDAVKSVPEAATRPKRSP